MEEYIFRGKSEICHHQDFKRDREKFYAQPLIIVHSGCSLLLQEIRYATEISAE
jgi:hypothetical protein